MVLLVKLGLLVLLVHKVRKEIRVQLELLVLPALKGILVQPELLVLLEQTASIVGIIMVMA